MEQDSRPLSRRARFEILRRDGFTCRYCGGKAPDVELTVDHVIPVALGGGNDPTNLVTACQRCNAGKGSTSPDEQMVADVDAAALLFAKAMERAAEMQFSNSIELDKNVEAFEKLWNGWGYGPDDNRKTVPLGNGWVASVERWLSLGLSLADFDHLIGVTMRGPAPMYEKWKYFCGCCWRRLTERQELARQLIEDGKV